jgi:hypothetical protein
MFEWRLHHTIRHMNTDLLTGAVERMMQRHLEVAKVWRSLLGVHTVAHGVAALLHLEVTVLGKRGNHIGEAVFMERLDLTLAVLVSLVCERKRFAILLSLLMLLLLLHTQIVNCY